MTRALSGMELERHFWSKVDQSGGPDACWPWQGQRGTKGYGMQKTCGKQIGTHRLAFMFANGSIDPDLFVLHSCDNPPCCNPAHLTQGTQKDNVAQRIARGRSATGDRNASRLYPERRPRGDSHPSRLHPELTPRGENHGRAKLTEADVRLIRETYQPIVVSAAALAKQFGVSGTQIFRILKGKEWR